ncbi:hypothetical protein CcaverHIS002_0706050 [Cutaneotrichosporon cavernicola]|uniref:Uncharacterized protein n=1 Tax=Cutaneotrichosporon cavernicola TaxID=279322 RepID=A0AA48QZ58_9TREE|nr:uncharacterized protein CcaverHIS019_0706090 [Cutaneotrichosporon cavernicola]BEI87259.1 hypothetical protein CcaverHIS002_0706050 [Cutaneotrichosporon cavernicola]BEI95028.1 hypothetical protein CcaverHIS019_0706090 [Cutaneotrichosporon cavernicola]BEJ02802.1 hypothetical protein CcaverHIS631_0705970 [Cutaneotrichosporon cavernicola]BEJ10555.1 hypothetical protein CcaverHIS641_0705900 [Cutaneotrichosporon cavernicola]
MSATQTEEKTHVDDASDKPKKTPTKKKTVKKNQQSQPAPESDASSDEEYEQQAAPQRQAQQYAEPQELTRPPRKQDNIDDVAMQPLRERKHMISQTIGEQHMKEIQEKRDKEGDEKQSLKIKISLDLDVEVHLSARVKGDITIGLLD